MSERSIEITTSSFLNKPLLTALPLINGTMLIIAYAATPDGSKCGSKPYTSSKSAALGVSVLSIGLALLNAMGGVTGRDLLPYLGLMQAVNLTAIIVLSVMIGYSGSPDDTRADQMCDTIEPILNSHSSQSCKQLIRGKDPCKSGKGWIVAALVVSILNFLFLFLPLHASTAKFGSIFPRLAVSASVRPGMEGEGESSGYEGEGSESSEFAPRLRVSPKMLRSGA